MGPAQLSRARSAALRMSNRPSLSRPTPAKRSTASCVSGRLGLIPRRQMTIVILILKINRYHALPAVLRIHDILVWIRIRGSMPLTNGSGCGSGSSYFRHWPSRGQQKIMIEGSGFRWPKNIRIRLIRIGKTACQNGVNQLSIAIKRAQQEIQNHMNPMSYPWRNFQSASEERV